MRLAITILGEKSTVFIADVLTAITTHKCNILELSFSEFTHSSTAAYLLVEGNWNHLAKLETVLVHFQKRFNIKICSVHLDAQEKAITNHIPYSLEIISIAYDNILQDILTFLSTHQTIVKELKANCYPAAYTQTPLFHAKFVLFIPIDIQLISFREELINFCDDCNIDAIFEPIKR
jgi:glycine cleavage system transcriptional repressor